MKIAFLTLIFAISVFSINTRFLESEAPIDTNIEATLSGYSRETLYKIAFSVENYDRQKRNLGENFVGGIHDYIFNLSNEEIIKIVKNYTEDYPELKVAGKLEELAGVTTKTKSETLKDFISQKSIEELRQLALAFEAYSRKQENKEGLIGGLVDYVQTLDKDAIIKIIMGYIEKYPELTKPTNLKLLIQNKDALDENELLKRYDSYDKETLIHYALACDDYDNVRNPKIGGIHDYIFRLDKEAIKKVLLTCVKQHPELSLEGELEKIANEYNASKPGIFGSILEYLNNFNKEDLIKLAIAGETYDREVRKVHLYGGLHDYIFSLNETQIQNIIKGYVIKYPELRAPGKLESLAGIKKVIF